MTDQLPPISDPDPDLFAPLGEELDEADKRQTLINEARSVNFEERLSAIRDRQQTENELPMVAAVPMQPRPPRGRGCFFPMLVIGVVTLGLVLVAFFLPPLADYNPVLQAVEADEDDGFIRLNSKDVATVKDGLQIMVLPSDPGEAFEVAIEAVPAENYRSGEVPATTWQCPKAAQLPRGLQPISTVYSLQTEGTAPARVGLRVAVAPNTDTDFLDLYGWYSGAWQFVPAQLAAERDAFVTNLGRLPDCLLLVEAQEPIPVLGAVLDPGQTPLPQVVGSVNRVYVTGIRPTALGTLQGDPAEIDMPANVIPVISNQLDAAVVDTETIRLLLQNREARARHAVSLVDLYVTGGYAGIALDYREVPLELRDPFSDLVRLAAEALHQHNRTLIVIVPPAEYGENGWSGGAYDWRTLGQFADEIMIRAPLDPLAYAPVGTVENMLRWGVGEVNRSHLLLAVSALSVEELSDGTFYLIGFSEDPEAAVTALNETLEDPYTAETGLDSTSQTQYISTFNDSDLLRTLWITTPEALANRIALAQQFRLGGVTLMDVHAPGVDLALIDIIREN